MCVELYGLFGVIGKGYGMDCGVIFGLMGEVLDIIDFDIIDVKLVELCVL